MEFSESFAWQSGHLDEIKRIVANYVVREADADDDQRRNTDLFVPQTRIACRIRKHSDMVKYGHQFTLRSRRTSGRETELAKVVSGWGDYVFYAFESPDDLTFAAWLLGDLSVFRLWFNRILAQGRKPWVERSNHDSRASEFMAFNIADLPPQFVIGRKAAPGRAA